MLHTRRIPGSVPCWPRLIRPLVLALLVATVAAGARAADPPQPADPVDDFRAAFRNNLDTITRQSRDLPSLRETQAEKQKDFDSEPTKQSNIDDLAQARERVANAEKELNTALETRSATLSKRLKEDLATGDVADRVALVNLIGAETAGLRYNSKLIPDYLTKLHPEVPQLIELTEAGPNNPLELRVAAALALGKTNGDVKVIVPALAKVLRDPQNPVALRLAAAEAIGRPVNRLLQAATQLTPPGGRPGAEKEDSTRELRVVLIDAGHLAWAALVGGLKDPSPRVRLACAIAAKDVSSAFLEQAPIADRAFFANCRPLLTAFRDQMPKLGDALEDPDPAVRQLALSILEDLAVARPKISGNLSPDLPAKPMSRTGRPSRPEALPEVVPVGRQVPAGKEAPAPAPAPAEASDLSAALKAALPALVQALKNPDVRTRRSAGYTLEDMGGDALPVLPDLTRALSDPDRFVRWTILRILGHLAPQEAKVVVPAVVPLVGDPDMDVRAAALKSLENYGKDAAGMGAGPAIAKALPREDPLTQVAATRTLQAIGEWDRSTLAVVADLLQVADVDVRVSAAETLGKAGKHATPFRPAVERAMEAGDEKVRVAASEALLRIPK
jgi:HEAT repeat protein